MFLWSVGRPRATLDGRPGDAGEPQGHPWAGGPPGPSLSHIPHKVNLDGDLSIITPAVRAPMQGSTPGADDLWNIGTSLQGRKRATRGSSSGRGAKRRAGHRVSRYALRGGGSVTAPSAVVLAPVALPSSAGHAGRSCYSVGGSTGKWESLSPRRQTCMLEAHHVAWRTRALRPLGRPDTYTKA